MKSLLRAHFGNPIELLLRIVLGGAFLLSGTLKIIDPIAFQQSVRGYDILDDPWPGVIAVGLPWLEVFCGICVVLRFFYPGALVLLSGSLLVFMIAVSSVWVRGIDLSCGCFGEKLPIDNYAVMLLIEVSLLSIAVGLLYWWRGQMEDATQEAVPSAT